MATSEDPGTWRWMVFTHLTRAEQRTSILPVPSPLGPFPPTSLWATTEHGNTVGKAGRRQLVNGETDLGRKLKARRYLSRPQATLSLRMTTTRPHLPKRESWTRWPNLYGLYVSAPNRYSVPATQAIHSPAHPKRQVQGVKNMETINRTTATLLLYITCIRRRLLTSGSFFWVVRGRTFSFLSFSTLRNPHSFAVPPQHISMRSQFPQSRNSRVLCDSNLPQLKLQICKVPAYSFLPFFPVRRSDFIDSWTKPAAQ